MSTVLCQGEEYLAAAVTGDAGALAKLFSARLKTWNMSIIQDEHGTYSIFADLEENIAPHIAFSLIPTAIEIAQLQTTKESIDCALWLLLGLVEATQTTEIPLALKTSFSHLQASASSFGAELIDTLQSIQQHYRNSF